jgi:cyclic pyranopterin phosphate synthase
MLKEISGVDEVAITTNGMLLANQVVALKSAGLDRLNISLDTLSEATFQKLSRREGLDSVLRGIDAAIDAGMSPRLNALILRDINLDEVVDLVEFALGRNLVLRFIEFMPLDQDRSWQAGRVVNGDELRKILSFRFGPLAPIARSRDAQPSHDYQFDNGSGTVGFIDPVSNPFCGNCDRLRLTADGKLRNCLFGREEWDVKTVLENVQLSEFEKQEHIDSLLRAATWAKHASHGIAQDGFTPPQRAMFQIGG